MKRIDTSTPKQGRTRWTPASAIEVLTALDASGQSVRAFAEARGLDPQRLYVWRRRFGGKAHAPVPAAFVPVRVRAEDAPERARASVELLLPGGRMLRIGASFDEPSLRRLLRVLEEDASC